MPGHVRLVSGSPSKAAHTKPGLQEPPSPGGHKEKQECAERVALTCGSYRSHTKGEGENNVRATGSG